ncbi:hypothetical protein LIER_11286 [Lithospermum erythrorhizon]|uniref:Uncharacterized protein n=1 Tax=Lithospermum erythrorhizon TaxID=34254 RepID=A0AAV3PPU5_LITER
MVNKKLLPKPPRIRGQEANRDKSGYCEYYKEYGHDTNECHVLKIEMEKLIKRGHLKEFVDTRGRPQARPRSPPRENRNYPQGRGASPSHEENRNRRDLPLRLTGRIDRISGVRAGRGDSRNSKKNYARREVYSSPSSQISVEGISFSDAELQGLEFPYDDPVVISLFIANYTVERMLVDTRSSTHILYLSMYDKLGLPRNMLQPMNTALVGFTGHSIYPKGIATLDFTVGSDNKKSTT